MRTIEQTTRFKKDLRRESKGRFRTTLEADLRMVLGFLVEDLPLPGKFRDHSLTGDWQDHRDCHVRPDLVLIYFLGAETLRLVRLGSHSELEI